MRLKYRFAFLTTLMALTVGHHAFAEGFDVRHFSPAAGPEAVFSVESTKTLHHLDYDVKVLMDYANTPLSFQYFDETAKLQHMIGVDVSASIGLLDILEVGIVLPFMAYEHYNDKYSEVNLLDVPSATTGVFGDMEMHVKGTILKREDYHGFGLGAGVIMSIPTGKQDALIGSPSVTGKPYIAADYEIGPVEMMLNAGFKFRKKTEFLDYTLTHTFDYGFGVVYHAVPDWLDIKGEIFGETPLSDVAQNKNENSAEWLVGAKVKTPIGMDITAGAGTGIGEGVRNPKVRALFGLEYTPRVSDADEDGIRDRKDFCVNIPGVEAFEGCPDPNSDGDGWCDPWVDNDEIAVHFECKRTDLCPDQEGVDEYEGCPTPDRDEDGWCDEWVSADRAAQWGCTMVDACPDLTGEDAYDGCPNPDTDLDGWCDPWITDQAVADKYFCKIADICPDYPGDDENSGCPAPDEDGDGICAPFVEELGLYDQFFCSGSDACPDLAEDFDDYLDEDGCPDPDNDSDAICDEWVTTEGMLDVFKNVCKGIDKCPAEPETINGYKDSDGCPDKGESLVIIREDKIEIKDKIYFNTNKATIQKKSNPLLDQLAQTIRANQSIRKISVEGHTDDTGKYEKNLVLSRQRAEAVVEALVKRGCDPERFEAVGYGPDKPLDPSKTKAARALNRRVEFIILDKQ